MPFSEVYSALQTGTIDGQENPVNHIFASKLHEVQKHLSLTAHVYTAALLVINFGKFAKMKPEYQTALRIAAKLSTSYERQLNAAKEAGSLQAMKDAGVAVVIEPDVGAFRDAVVEDALSSYDEAGVRTSWEKTLSRRQDDPDGAITAARTLLETVCKHVLDHSGEAYKDDDLPKLYSKTAKLLNLAPSQHTEETFKAILGGCHTVVQNIGTLRNKIGDAHGQGRRPVKAAPRHAALAVNLAGAMATFIIEKWYTIMVHIGHDRHA